jgi:uncharacterized protein (DUF305 family)
MKEARLPPSLELRRTTVALAELVSPATGRQAQRRAENPRYHGAVRALAIGRLGAVFFLTVFAASCQAHTTRSEPPIVQPGAPGKPSRRVTAAEASDVSKIRHTPADVRFMQGMIGHHAQALEMTALVTSRTASEDFQRLALRIELSQADEIAMMQRWLDVRGERRPDAHAHHGSGAPLMPGMLTADEMRTLAGATGGAFEKLFLEGMIKHHEGALTMVRELFATPGAGQESEIDAFASDVDADQRMEIDRMRGMLSALTRRPGPEPRIERSMWRGRPPSPRLRWSAVA